MTQTKSLIHTDPFAYTREGKPYVSTHQWLAQIIFYGVWSVGGATGQILFRGMLVTLAFVGLLCIDTKRIWPNFFVVLTAAYFNRASFMDRPQLFSFLFFVCFLYAAFFYLRKSAEDKSIKSKWRLWLIIALAGVQILWVNTHGAAAIYGMIVMAALLAQRGIQWFASSDIASRRLAVSELKYLAITVFVLVISAFVSPNTWHTFADVFVYSGSQELALVREWQPRGSVGYVTEIVPFWLLAGIALALGKKHRIFSIGLLLVMGYLSVQSYRHGLFFIFTALGIAIYQLSYSDIYINFLAKALKKPVWTAVIFITLFISMAWYGQYKNISIVQREGYGGFGIFASAEGAYDFVERVGISGKMFNTYDIGNYLLYRGYPNRKVYVDGRAVDYGYDFIRDVAQAGFDTAVWERMEKQYGFTYALIEFNKPPWASPEDDVSYVTHLAKNKNWVLVYVDDKVAVYVKNVAENKKNIVEYGYRLITPEGLELGSVFEGLKDSDIKTVEQELERASKSAPKSIKASLILSHHYVQAGNLEKAQAFAEAAIDAQPYRPEAYEALGAVAVAMKQWAQAGAILEKSIKLTGGVGLPINYNYLAGIFSNAGDVAKSSYYRQKAMSFSK